MLTERKSNKIRDIIQGYFVQVQCVTGCTSPSVHMKPPLKKKLINRDHVQNRALCIAGQRLTDK